MTKLNEEQTAIKEQIEHQNTLVDIRNVLSTKAGKSFIKYLLKHFEMGTLPEQGLPDPLLREYLGFLKAGQAVFAIVSQASPEDAALLLAQIERERYAIRKD